MTIYHLINYTIKTENKLTSYGKDIEKGNTYK